MRGTLLALASRLRFPWLFALTALLFVLSLLLPDPFPLVDELLLGLLTLLLASWRRRGPDDEDRIALPRDDEPG